MLVYAAIISVLAVLLKVKYLGLLFLQEDAYVDFLKLRGVPLMERECSPDIVDIVPQVSFFCIIFW